MRAEEDIKRRIQRRRCLVWVCIWIAIMVVVVTLSWCLCLLRRIAFTVTEVSLGNFTERGSYANFSAYTGGVAVPFNIPIRLRENSTWTAKALVSPLNIVNGTKEWTDMFRISPYLGGASILNGKMQTSAAMASYGDFVPLASIAIDGLVNVGTLEYWGLNLMRVLDIGKELGGTDLTAPGPGPMPNITALDFTVAGDRIRTGLRIDLDASNPTPLGFHLRNITFNLTLDGRPLAYCLIPELKFTAGSTTLTIPSNSFLTHLRARDSNNPPLLPPRPLYPRASQLPHFLSNPHLQRPPRPPPHSSPSPRPTSLISDQIQVVLQTFDYRQAKLIGATNVTVLDEQMRRVQWLSLVASQINFEYPFQTLQGAAGSVVAGWILGIVLRSLGISTWMMGLV
ncbi:hypothetical protein BC829DRAFT_388094 [Chytridium lagenaria]|nr:hypothetical protein BC829DRAFT_388094 [Chytridium lagenaria]